MKLVELKTNEFGQHILTCEKSYLFGLYVQTKRFISLEEVVEDRSWNWMNMKTGKIVDTIDEKWNLDIICRNSNKIV